VLLPHRKGSEAALPRVDKAAGDADGARLVFPDGSEDVVIFRPDGAGGPRVEALGKRKDGAVHRRLSVD
jgi:hypothetical protein